VCIELRERDKVDVIWRKKEADDFALWSAKFRKASSQPESNRG
jgi:hypothetical protein